MAKKGLLEAIGIGAALSAVAGAYKFSEFAVRAKKLHEVGPENEVFIRLVQHVQIDLAETERLLSLPAVKFALSKNPEKLSWIRRTISDTRYALSEIGRYTGRVNEDLQHGHHVGIRHRFRWVLNDYEKIVHRRMELAMCHQSLTQIVGFLSSLEPLACCEESQVIEPPRQAPEAILDYKSIETTRRRKGGVREEKYEKEVWREDRSFDLPNTKNLPIRANWPISRL
ncbi:hypothetical protein AOQ84DRAFT_382037 [Glonium stellatum]|uniref:Uncharacterized protein n=1 Tax=Glonium stellatum TaxID=574774 RepID=A0A8E2EQI6_9PEZI|nr:hypothetical protein AOQ84DRAFT_382037 [Glonium stellatum]